MGDDGPLYKKDWDGEYRPEEGLFGTPTGHVKRDFLGEPVPTRDIFGNQKRAADGSRLYEAEPDHEAEAVTGIVAVIAIVAVVAAAVAAWIFAKLVRWWWPRLSGSIRKDIDDRRLSWTSLAWLSPIVLLVAIVVVGEVRQNLRDEALARIHRTGPADRRAASGRAVMGRRRPRTGSAPAGSRAGDAKRSPSQCPGPAVVDFFPR